MKRKNLDTDEIRRLYIEKGLKGTEIAEIMECSNSTIYNRLEEINVDTRCSFDYIDHPTEYDYVPLRMDEGYPYWEHQTKNNHNVMVHRLLAISKFGFDAVSGMDVHHKNGVKWDNRPDNIDIMTRSEHQRYHRLKESERI